MDDLGEIRDSKVVSALGLEDGTAVKVGVGVLRIDVYCLRIVRNSQVDIVFGSVGGAAVVVCIGVARVDFDRLAIIFNRPVDLVVGAISDAAIVIVIGVSGSNRHLNAAEDLSRLPYCNRTSLVWGTSLELHS